MILLYIPHSTLLVVASIFFPPSIFESYCILLKALSIAARHDGAAEGKDEYHEGGQDFEG